jgi:hypothetical protein
MTLLTDVKEGRRQGEFRCWVFVEIQRARERVGEERERKREREERERASEREREGI